MNYLYKVFCRTFQLAFRAAMPILPYREPQIFSSTQDLIQPLKQRNIRSALLVTDEFLRSSGATEELENTLHLAGIRCAIYDKVRPNPTVQNVETAFKMYEAKSCQCLIAFGGGSTIELAVTAGVAAEQEPHAEGAAKFIRAIRDLNARMGIPEKLTGIQKADIPAMAKHAHREANPLYPVPRLMDAGELEQFYHTVADWSETNANR